MITDMRRKVELALIYLRIPDLCSAPTDRLTYMISRMDGIPSNPSAMDKLAKITFDAVRRF